MNALFLNSLRKKYAPIQKSQIIESGNFGAANA